MRGLLILAVVILVLLTVPPLLRTWRRGLPAKGRQPAELVKDPVCQTYVVMSRAVKSEIDGVPTYFCSHECAARFAREKRRA